MLHPKEVSHADRLSQEEANAVIRLVETLRAEGDGIPVPEFAESLGLPESYVRELIAMVREPQRLKLDHKRRIGFFGKLWHLAVGLSALVAFWAAYLILIGFARAPAVRLGEFWLLAIYAGWFALCLCYYRHVIFGLLRKVAEGFKP